MSGWKPVCVAICLLGAVACHTPFVESSPPDPSTWRVQKLPATPQVRDGDPEAGFKYLIYGDYIGSGVPWDYLQKFVKDKPDTVLRRPENGQNVMYTSNIFTAANGIEVVSGNCFSCHAGEMNNEILLGMGSHNSDYIHSNRLTAKLLTFIVKTKYGKKSPEYEAYENFGKYIKAIAPKIVTDNPGVNPAFRLEEACVAHRDTTDLSYQKKANFKMKKFAPASDVPPLWNVKKKNALYYNGMGRGDFSKLLMQASVLGIADTLHAREAQKEFRNVYAWLLTLEPPAYPHKLNLEKVQKGEQVFNLNCSKCHGVYGDSVSYPNKLVSLEVVKTDPVYAQYFTRESGLADWYNRSWFAKTGPRSWLKPSEGYVAPPLDGIWATAPYLHNGSVPSLYTLLNSSTRPEIWEKGEYDPEHVGWKFLAKKSKKAYVTTRLGYGNGGHYFGDKLSEEERMAVVEYLKTL